MIYIWVKGLGPGVEMFRGEPSFRRSVLGFRVRDWAQGPSFQVVLDHGNHASSPKVQG